MVAPIQLNMTCPGSPGSVTILDNYSDTRVLSQSHASLPHFFQLYPSLVLISLVSVCHGIRVYWNTNEGPIVPPTTTLPPVPKPPFHDPAPVWEIQSNDIENPNPFVYVVIFNNQSQSLSKIVSVLLDLLSFFVDTYCHLRQGRATIRIK